MNKSTSNFAPLTLHKQIFPINQPSQITSQITHENKNIVKIDEVMLTLTAEDFA